MYKESYTKKEAEFLLSKMYIFDIPHFYIIWKILKNPIVGRPIDGQLKPYQNIGNIKIF